jgi:hypothetical protein
MTTLDQRRQVAMDQYRQKLTDGVVFHYGDESHSSADRMSYHGPLNHRDYAKAVKALGNIAGMSDRMAAAVAHILPKLNLRGTKPQLLASLHRALGDVHREGYFDVVGATGPNASRRSAYEHPTTLRDAVWLELIVSEVEIALGEAVYALGWCLTALVDELEVRPPAYCFPGVADQLQKRAERLTERRNA